MNGRPYIRGLHDHIHLGLFKHHPDTDLRLQVPRFFVLELPKYLVIATAQTIGWTQFMACIFPLVYVMNSINDVKFSLS